MGFIDTIIAKARLDKKTIVLPETSDKRTIEAAAKVLEKGFANIVLLGDPEQVKTVAPQWDISGATIIDPAKSDKLEAYTNAFYEMRKAKGVTLEKAQKTMLDPLYFGVMMVKMNEADGMVAGAINSTANTLRPALQILKTAPGTKLVSSFFMMDRPGLRATAPTAPSCSPTAAWSKIPTADELSEIAMSSAKSFRQLTGVDPDRGHAVLLDLRQRQEAR